MLGSLSNRERLAVLAFGGGTVVLFLVFTAGALMGRFGGSPAVAPASDTASSEPVRVDSERFLVEAGVFDTPAAGEETLMQLRRQYTSAWGATDPDDRRYHVYAGPYPSAQAETVASELRARGLERVAVRPYAPRAQTP